MLRQFKP